MDLQKKTANSLILPAAKGKKVKIIMENGALAETTIQNIVGVGYNQGYIFISFQTNHSYYENVPLPIVIKSNFLDGQFIYAGQPITKEDGSMEEVAEVLEVNEKGIVIKTMDGNLLISPLEFMKG